MKTFLHAACASVAVLAAGSAWAAEPDHRLPSIPQTIIRGVIAADRDPVLRITSGQTVKIDTLSHAGLTEDPVAFFAQAGIQRSQVLDDAIAIAALTKEKGWAGHVLTGPIFIEGAEPGDMLEVRVHRLEHRVPYGVNTPGPGGVAPDLVPERMPKILKFDLARNVVLFGPGIEAPLRRHMGIMAVAPGPDEMRVGSRAPGLFGGNMDFKDLTDGATLYLPVLRPGALFYAGDPHAAQGDGEVAGNAVESSLTATFQFILHKGQGAAMKSPRMEDAQNYYVMGLDPDLDLAMRKAVVEAVEFLKARKGLSTADAYSLSSIAVDFAVAQAVDGTLGIYGKIPRSLFAERTPYWAAPPKGR